VNKLLTLILFSVATGCATVETKAQSSTISSLETPTLNFSSFIIEKPTVSGPNPTVIVGHGCDGLKSNPALLDYAKVLNSWGFNAVFYDSFQSRGLSGGAICSKAMRIPPEYRSKEAQEAAKWIKQQPWHTGKVGYLGISHGGSTAIHIGMLSPKINEISATVAMYPSCSWVVLGLPFQDPEGRSNSRGYFMKIPTQLHLGSKDDWTPPYECKKDMMNAELFEYEGATHAFDLNVPDRTVFGYRVGYDRKATLESRERIKKFLSEHM
jgi:dienelactone hydrolase